MTRRNCCRGQPVTRIGAKERQRDVVNIGLNHADGQPSGRHQDRAERSKRTHDLSARQHQQRKERDDRVEAAKAGVDVHGITPDEGRLRHVAASKVEHDRRNVGPSDHAPGGYQLTGGRQPGTTAHIEDLCTSGQPVKEKLTGVHLAILVRKHLVVAGADRVETRQPAPADESPTHQA